MERFSLVDGYLPEEQLAKLQEFFQTNVLWTYGWQSNREKVPFSHWNHDFLKTHRQNQSNEEQMLLENEALEPIRALWLKLKSDQLKDHSLVRCYANAHTFGIEGYPHVDSRKPGNYTTIVYINPCGNPNGLARPFLSMTSAISPMPCCPNRDASPYLMVASPTPHAA
jgi:hypothetical protein